MRLVATSPALSMVAITKLHDCGSEGMEETYIWIFLGGDCRHLITKLHDCGSEGMEEAYVLVDSHLLTPAQFKRPT